jgi:hypothetical protein
MSFDTLWGVQYPKEVETHCRQCPQKSRVLFVCKFSQ